MFPSTESIPLADAMPKFYTPALTLMASNPSTTTNSHNHLAGVAKAHRSIPMPGATCTSSPTATNTGFHLRDHCNTFHANLWAHIPRKHCLKDSLPFIPANWILGCRFSWFLLRCLRVNATLLLHRYISGWFFAISRSSTDLLTQATNENDRNTAQALHKNSLSKKLRGSNFYSCRRFAECLRTLNLRN